MANEKKTDIFISRLLENAEIKYTPNGSDIKEIQEALKIVLEHCSIESTAEYLKSLPRNKKAERYSRAGTAWSQKEERELLRLHQQGNSVKRISLILKRSTGAIESKLRKLGCPLYYEK